MGLTQKIMIFKAQICFKIALISRFYTLILFFFINNNKKTRKMSILFFKKIKILIESKKRKDLFPVGRLDKDSEGLLLMTNDGEFANAMTHPTKHVPKTYRVTVRPGITEEQLTALSTGIVIDDRMTAPAQVRVISKEENRVVLEIILYEGRNRQIRKMCEELGLEVARLKRTAVGSVKLGMLQQGKWRNLSEEEVRKLMLAADMDKEKRFRK